MNANRFESKRREYRKKQLDKGEQEKEKNMGYNSASIKQWPLHNKEFEAMKNTESKFSILESLPDDNIQEINMLKDRMIINKWEGDRRKEAEENAQKAHKENGCMDIPYNSDSSAGEEQKESRSSGIEIFHQEKGGRLELDRVMVSDEFPSSHAVFQPFLVSDHSPALPMIPTCWQKKSKSFRFANYIADKLDFINNVIEGWKEAQTLVYREPYNKLVKTRAIEVLCEYNEVVNDEEKLLAQKARIDRLNAGDKIAPSFINSDQSAFIPGRLIQDKILLSQEILKGYGRKNGPKRCSMKIDLQKAYDIVENTLVYSPVGYFGLTYINGILKDFYGSNGDSANGREKVALKQRLADQSMMYVLSPNVEKVKWYELVWFKQCIPKHSFCLWLAMLRKLLTQDKIMAWGKQTGLLCPLWNKVNDSHNHLFFLYWKCSLGLGISIVLFDMMGEFNRGDACSAFSEHSYIHV
ncbi:RNA-directed DNA polymerase, eukaryota, reverse transcriptase zinc-binding domain protein [Tanacetum coccineum]